ncbi:hypothetical protein SAMN06893096_11336 [Geodermatophilus pulveris]|uniref:GGDEF domain-containing protein n=1 Tax=Geodermatophilus pulveris TaxID=1564159 RepID=A0A239JB99_9ACTN|nr:hypothetical protein [Geodermatophilus pulveris]SNT01914.1 hypothetical protein SAMN06893096_11336 [Geodermatophilus pulveris]
MPPTHNPFSVSLPVSLLLPPEDDVTSLLPGPNSVSAHVAERLSAVPAVPAALIVLRLSQGDGRPAADALAAATSVVARSLRGDDWLGRSGPDEFAVLLGGSAADAEVAAARLTAAIAALDVPGLGACAGVTDLEAGSTAAETLQRAARALHAACAGDVVRHRSTS